MPFEQLTIYSCRECKYEVNRVLLYTGPKTPPSHAAGSVLPRWEDFGTCGSAELRFEVTLSLECSGISASSSFVGVCHSFQRVCQPEADHEASHAADAVVLLDASGLEVGAATSSAVPFPFHRF